MSLRGQGMPSRPAGHQQHAEHAKGQYEASAARNRHRTASHLGAQDQQHRDGSHHDGKDPELEDGITKHSSDHTLFSF